MSIEFSTTIHGDAILVDVKCERVSAEPDVGIMSDYIDDLSVWYDGKEITDFVTENEMDLIMEQALGV